MVNWLRSEQFNSALANARAEKQLLYWDEAEILAAESITNLRKLMNDPQMPPAVRLKATSTTLEHARKFLPTEPGLVLPAPAEPAPTEPAPISETVHKNAQPGCPLGPAPSDAETPAPAPEPPPASSKAGRNHPCPCGSGRKFKHCCLRKAAAGCPPGPAQASAA